MANDTQKTDWTKNELGSLWKRQAKTSGEKYLTGVLKFKEAVAAGQEVQVIIFSNKSKKAENQPDLRVYVSEKQGQAQASTPTVANKTVTAPLAQKKVAIPVEESSELL